jgi:hypothetical protein
LYCVPPNATAQKMTRLPFNTKDVLSAVHVQEKHNGNIREARKESLTATDSDRQSFSSSI